MTLRKNDFDEENIIIGGDFNCPPNPLLDKKGGLLIPQKSVEATIDSLQEELDLVDIWRIKNPAKRSFTWSQNSPMIFCRLDYWLISNSLHDLVVTTDIIPAIKTALMSNIHKQIRFIKTPSPIVPLVKDYDLSKKPYDSYHWNEW